jgi:hypothetical protein
MKSIPYFLAILVVLGTFTACEPADEPLISNESNLDNPNFREAPTASKQQDTEVPAYFMSILNEYKEVPVNTYTVKLLDRVVNGTGENATTTFNYEVKGTGETPQLDSFFLELPDCAGELLSWSPLQSSNLLDDEIKWNSSVAKDGSQKYSLTFKGVVPYGLINTTVTRGSIVGKKLVLGPCSGVFTLSGSIFIDANKNGVKDAEETGIASIPVDLFNSKGKLGTVNTGINGIYSFMVLQGDYRIEVGSDLLEDSNYTAVGDSFIDLPNVTNDLTGFNFGYLLNNSKVINDLENKVKEVNTETAKFWQQVVDRKGPNRNLYTKEEIRAFLIAVEQLHLDGPFFFGENKEKAASEIFSRPIRSETDAFLRELLATELNVVSGRGALLEDGTLDVKFNEALVIYAEAVACRETGNCSTSKSYDENTETKAVSSNDTRLLSAFNGSGGI